MGGGQSKSDKEEATKKAESEQKERMKKSELDHLLQMKKADLESERIGTKAIDLEMKKVDAESKRVELDRKKEIAALNVQIKLEESKEYEEALKLMKERAELEFELKKLETNPDHVTISIKEEEIADSNSSERACIIETEGHENTVDNVVEDFVSKMKQRVPKISG